MTRAVDSLPLGPQPERHRIVHPWLSAETYAGLLSAAKRRNTHVDRLAAAILTTIVADDLFAAVLDSAD